MLLDLARCLNHRCCSLQEGLYPHAARLAARAALSFNREGEGGQGGRGRASASQDYSCPPLLCNQCRKTCVNGVRQRGSTAGPPPDLHLSATACRLFLAL
jgi:hypothetical protein